jgi:guanine deaminase
MDFMKEAIKEASFGMRHNHGGPFGAVIVRGGKIIARAHNCVLKTNDPTMHAEIIAISKASRKLKRFDLNDCEIYSTCEPCPMCFSAIEWAKIGKVYFSNTRKDAKRIGFADDEIYLDLVCLPKCKNVKEIRVKSEGTKKLFKEWVKKEDKKMY